VAPLQVGSACEGSISRVGPGDINGKSVPIYSRAEAEADAAKWKIGGSYQGWIYFDQPSYILFKRPYLELKTQITYLCAAAIALLTLFGLRLIVGLALRSGSRKKAAV
jgi:hypothetical protein